MNAPVSQTLHPSAPASVPFFNLPFNAPAVIAQPTTNHANPQNTNHTNPQNTTTTHANPQNAITQIPRLCLPIEVIPEGHPTGLIELLDPQNPTQIVIVRRHIADTIEQKMKLFKNLHEKLGSISDKGFLLRGSGGTRKSITLYRIAHQCRISGWLVLYIPKLSEIVSASETVATQKFLDAIKNSKVLDHYKVQISEEQPKKQIVESITAALQTMKGKEIPPLLIAIDEWNSCFRESCPALLAHFLRNIFKVGLSNGVAICAVSSTWGGIPTDIFDNADRQELERVMEPYSEEELLSQYNASG